MSSAVTGELISVRVLLVSGYQCCLTLNVVQHLGQKLQQHRHHNGMAREAREESIELSVTRPTRYGRATAAGSRNVNMVTEGLRWHSTVKSVSANSCCYECD